MEIGALFSQLPSRTHFILLAADEAPTLKIPVEFADQASRAFSAYREKYGFGASEMKANCGSIFNSENIEVGRISYNGRIWDADGNPPNDQT